MIVVRVLNVMYATSTLKSFVAQLLELEGAEVGTVEPDGLEYLAPLPLQQTLKTGEFGRSE